jgi:hypothetical protein
LSERASQMSESLSAPGFSQTSGIRLRAISGITFSPLLRRHVRAMSIASGTSSTDAASSNLPAARWG